VRYTPSTVPTRGQMGHRLNIPKKSSMGSTLLPGDLHVHVQFYYVLYSKLSAPAPAARSVFLMYLLGNLGIIALRFGSIQLGLGFVLGLGF